jgi:glycosyltransferase involved in cell wall biosynthesis
MIMQAQVIFLHKAEHDLVSILICSKDRRQALEILAKDLLSMRTCYSFEIIVVEETDQPCTIDGTNYVSHPIAGRGIPYARNLALAYAKGEIIVFLDDDCIIYDEWLNKLLAPFKDESIVGVQGGVTVPHDTNPIGWVETLLGFPGGGHKRVLEAKGSIQETREISTLNCAYRRWIFEKVGGFQKELKYTGEDYVLAKQACDLGRCLFVPDALVTHKARGNLSKVWRWFVRRGRADIDVIRVGGWKSTAIMWLLRSSIVLKAVAVLVLSLLLFDSVLLGLAIGLLCYGLIQMGRLYKIWKQVGLPIGDLLYIPVVKFTMDLANDWGRIITLFEPQKSSKKSLRRCI